MKKNFLQKTVLCILILFSAQLYAARIEHNVTTLRCEYLINPLGVDQMHPRLSWQLQSNVNQVMQSAYEIRVANHINSLAKATSWSTGKITSSQSVNIEYNGPTLESGKRYYWQVRVWCNGKVTAWSNPAFFETGLLNTSDWKAKWITLAAENSDKVSKPAQYFRTEFNTTRTVQTARVYATSLGLYQLFINGQRISTDLFTPGWTSYNNRLQYQTYDVTSLIEKTNAIGAVVTDGWYRGHIGFGHQHNYYGKQLGLLVQLHIEYTDGTSEDILTNEKWKVTNKGPILSADIYNGEQYDATRELTGWNTTAYNESDWETASIVDHPYNTLIASRSVPVRAVKELPVIEKIKTPKGETVYDFGQNMVGWVRAQLKGQKGEVITLRFAEVLDKAGNFYTDNLRDAASTDTYTLKGVDGEVFEPQFTFHGFRYLKISGNSVDLSPEAFTGIVVHSDMELTGQFSCSDSLINKLQHNIQWGQRGNFLDVPTDCPQRDERLGWTGDAQVFSMTAGYNFNVAPFFEKWMSDVAVDQLKDGRIPHVVPNVIGDQGGSTAWADVSVIIPWNMYLIYNDKRILTNQYESMQRWIEFMRKRAGDDYIWTGDYHFGDWLAFATTLSDYPGATTEKDLIATAYFYHSTTLLSHIATVLGKQTDAATYHQLAAHIKEAFYKEYVTPNGRLVSHTQTAYLLALAYDLLPEEVRSKSINYLADDVRKFGHLTTGFVGTPLLCSTLSSVGREDLAFQLLNNKNYPSWLYPVLKGATTIWERWDGIKPDGSFQDVIMNSFNHYAYGAIGDWLYRYVAGIDMDEQNPGYKHFLLAPHPGGGLTHASSTFESVYGTIKSNWKIMDGRMMYDVEIPANTSAQVTLPFAILTQVKQNNNALTVDAKQIGKNVCFELGSGKYSFSYPISEK